MTWGRGPSRLQFFKQKFNCAPAWQINDFQMTRKLFPSHKNPRLQLKKQNMAKFKTFSRSDISSLAVRWRTVPEQCSFFLEGAKMMLKQLKRIYAWKFTVLLFLLYSTEFTSDTLHAALNTLGRYRRLLKFSVFNVCQTGLKQCLIILPINCEVYGKAKRFLGVRKTEIYYVILGVFTVLF